MELNDFIEAIREKNDASYSYGNDVLYRMGKDMSTFSDKQKLAGAIWLIGRAYAASPQRRSYGTIKNTSGYTDVNGKQPDKRPIWIPKTQNDGREGFFDEIAENINLSFVIAFADRYQANPRAYRFSVAESLNGKKQTKYTIEADELELLADSIEMVLLFNKRLSKAIEKFDGVDQLPDRKFENERVACNNHISFCSKFLHFYFPDIVFIIDNYAEIGGATLFKGEGTKGYWLDPSQEEYLLDETVFGEFSKEKVKQICGKVEDIVSGKTGTNVQTEMTNYIKHCVRSYLLGAFLRQNGIVPRAYLSGDETFRPMPRLIDTVFLNIKKELTEKEKKYADYLETTFYGHKK